MGRKVLGTLVQAPFLTNATDFVLLCTTKYWCASPSSRKGIRFIFLNQVKWSVGGNTYQTLRRQWDPWEEFSFLLNSYWLQSLLMLLISSNSECKLTLQRREWWWVELVVARTLVLFIALCLHFSPLYTIVSLVPWLPWNQVTWRKGTITGRTPHSMKCPVWSLLVLEN